MTIGYKQPAEVECSFRTLKSILNLRPLYHRLPERIEAECCGAGWLCSACA